MKGGQGRPLEEVTWDRETVREECRRQRRIRARLGDGAPGCSQSSRRAGQVGDRRTQSPRGRACIEADRRPVPGASHVAPWAPSLVPSAQPPEDRGWRAAGPPVPRAGEGSESALPFHAGSGGLPPAGWSRSPIPEVAGKGRMERPSPGMSTDPPRDRTGAGQRFLPAPGTVTTRSVSLLSDLFIFFGLSTTTGLQLAPLRPPVGGSGYVSGTLSHSVSSERCSRSPITERRNEEGGEVAAMAGL